VLERRLGELSRRVDEAASQMDDRLTRR
jgi:hypothetical protein